ncbi:MAG: gamma-glutamyltransferase, partial [Proteobacteria bacterium]|nr:gamma-glutamyltransferase [Pseudomonadota bacterium]
PESLLDPVFLDTYRRQVLGRPAARRGTTHISVIDAAGNTASLSVSNGEGSGYLVPGTGIMLNNLLGEDDINPHGFHRWPVDQRMCSMMAPTVLVQADGATVALGSGGSNRIRTAILQVLLNLLEFGMSIEDAVARPRIHFENDLLSIEDGFDPDPLAAVSKTFPNTEVWEEKNLFFGGVHAVRFDAGGGRFDGAGDLRRGGVALTV